ncbi:MAG: hypothetical protein L3J65_01005 [Robiginitomaculum sp.]|nr:hypothetical protein [Robiginitomaculum sp.]
MDKPNLQVFLAVLTGQLIDKCGGLVSAALECDVSKSQLQRAADPNHSYSLKASTIYHLEQACGEAVLSRELHDMSILSAPTDKRHPVLIGIDLADKATDLTVTIVSVMRDGRLSINEHKTLTTKYSDIRGLLARLVQSNPIKKLPRSKAYDH